MEIELSENLQQYQETIALGLTAKQLLFSMLSVTVGALTVLLLYKHAGMTLSCYIATPVVIPLAMGGFYNYHGLSFWQFLQKIMYFTFFNRPLIYASTEGMAELIQVYAAAGKEKAKQEKEDNVKGKQGRKDDMEDMKRKSVRIICGAVVGIIAVIALAVWWKLKR